MTNTKPVRKDLIQRMLTVAVLMLCAATVLGQAAPTKPKPATTQSSKPAAKPAAAPAQKVPKTQTITVNGVSFKMIAVQGGIFTMGCTSEQGSDCGSDESPSHRVTLSGYCIGETEVTQALWKAVMGGNPSSFKGDNLPVEQVSWDDVQVFIRKLNALTGKTFRLPTEAEWEYAARGGSWSLGYKYSGGSTLGDVAWYDGNSGSKTHPVGTKAPNELGLYDMSGNVWEWCSDWIGSYSSVSQTNPRGPSSGSYRVLRGGGWHFSSGCCRVSNRSTGSPVNRSYGIGFRLVLVP